MRRNDRLYSNMVVAVMVAALAVVAPFVLPVGPVPVSLCTFLIYLLAFVLGRRAAAAVLVYVLLGMAGLPVFAGFAGGAGTVLGPTGGYIFGYLPLAWLSGRAVERFPARRWVQMVAFTSGTLILYLLGTAWYCFQTGTEPAAAAVLCVLPFLPGDLAKIVVAGIVGPLLRRRLEQAELI